EVLYNPDRIKGPMKRVGERGEGKWQEISWEEGIKTLANRLNSAQRALFVTTEANGVTDHVANRLMETSNQFQLRVASPLFDNGSAAGYEKAYGGTPMFDLANASYLLSFGARFLETWHSPLMYSRAYGEFRASSGKTRGKLVQIEPRMSLTGAN